MEPKPDIASSLIKSLASVREVEEFQDFVVEADGKEFKCHRLILSANSGFFRGLLRSGMRETLEQKSKLEGVSKETFAAILDILYTGCDNLTRDNMLDIWSAADQLEITFVCLLCVEFISKNIRSGNVIYIWKAASQLEHESIIELCELFIIKNISEKNWIRIYSWAQKWGSVTILSNVQNFIKTNYEQVIKSQGFLCLPEDDLIEIIKSQDLVVSCEDFVIESIVNWINNRIKIKSLTMVGNLNEDVTFRLSERKEEEEQNKDVNEYYSQVDTDENNTDQNNTDENDTNENDTDEDDTDDDDTDEDDTNLDDTNENDTDEDDTDKDDTDEDDTNEDDTNEDDTNEDDTDEDDTNEDDTDEDDSDDDDDIDEDEKDNDNRNCSNGPLSNRSFNGITAMKCDYSMEFRQNCLCNFLQETRLFLVNTKTLEKLLRNPLVLGNKKTEEMIMDAILYKSFGRQHGLWSKFAVHRSCSGLENVGVMGFLDGSGFRVLKCQPVYKWIKFPKCSFISKCTSLKLIAYMTDFLVLWDTTKNSNLTFFVQNEWHKVKILSERGWLGVAVENYVYLIHSSNRKIQRFDPRFGKCVFKNCGVFPATAKIEHICSFDYLILVFSSEVINGVDKTSIYCLDTRSHIWEKVKAIEGSAKNITSFKKDKDLYIVQGNGNLWVVEQEEMNGIHMELKEVIWQGNIKIVDAIFIKDVLCFSSQYQNKKTVSVKSKLFPKVQMFTKTNGISWSNVVHAVVNSL